MICPQCKFDNLEHRKTCVRCGTLLQRLELSVDPGSPPRAKRPRRWRNMFYAFRRQCGFHWSDQYRRRILERSRRFSFPDWQELARIIPELLIPSLYQFRQKKKLKGTIFLSLFLLGILLVLLTPANGLFTTSVAFLALVQTCSLCDVYSFSDSPLIARLFYSVLLSLLGFWFFYHCYLYAADRVLRWTSSGQRVIALLPIYHGPELYSYNVVEVTPQPVYRRGDLVELNIRYSRNRQITDGGLIDRILAEPGQTVEIRDNRIYLDGSSTPSALRPLAPDQRLPALKHQLAPGEYLLMLSEGVRNAPRLIYRHDEIIGKITRIRYPYWRRRSF